MTSSNSLNATSAVPAFVSNERLRSNRKQTNKSLNDCCYSIANLALIAASIVGIIFTAKFFNDDPLYDIGDYLLTLRFYRQLVYIIVILPLILLVPLFNATSAFFLSHNTKQEIGKALITVRIIYQILLVILVFIALAFIAPSIKASSVATQIDFEIRKHIFRRYDNQFSFEFLDRIQVVYQCCDQSYYITNFNNNLPLSCYIQDGFYSHIHKYTCSEVLGYIVSNRCMIITVCFVIVLFALASLIAMDVIEIVYLSSRNYDVWEHESKRAVKNITPTRGNNSIQDDNNQDDSNDDGDDHHHHGGSLDNVDILSPDEISNRLKLRDREKETPLLPKQTPYQFQPNQRDVYRPTTIEKRFYPTRDRDLNDDLNNPTTSDFNDKNNSYSASLRTTSPILTRANYINSQAQRSHSPMFVIKGLVENNNQQGESINSSTPSTTLPAKSVLKKSTSFSRIDTTEEEEEEEEEDENEVQNYQRQLQRELQTRRSLLSVRFVE